MIAAVCWVPKGVAKIVPEEATEPDSNEEIEEANEASEEEKDEGEMDVDCSEEGDEVAHAFAAIEGLVKSKENKSSTDVNDIASRLNELMSGYDNEDDGNFFKPLGFAL